MEVKIISKKLRPEIPNGRELLEDLAIDDRKKKLNAQVMRVWTGFIRLRIGISGGVL
jgi:hypothetical protein